MKPLLYLVGDSISLHYGPHLERFTQPHFRFDRKRGSALDLDNPTGSGDASGGDSTQVLEFFQALHARNFRCEVLLLNCGLHDIKRAHPDQNLQTSPETYRANLEQIATLWCNMANHPMWVRTTPVDDSRHAHFAHAFARRESDVQTFNAIADETMKQHGIPTIDLYSFSKLIPEPFCDHVHFTEEIRTLQGAFLAGAVEGLR